MKQIVSHSKRGRDIMKEYSSNFFYYRVYPKPGDNTSLPGDDKRKETVKLPYIVPWQMDNE